LHLDDESLERLLHGELDPDREESVRSHLATCPLCEARLKESRALESRLFGLLGKLAHDAPEIDWDWVRHAPTSRRNAGSRIAASIAFLLLAGGILYALPESPVRGWIDRLLGENAPEAPVPGDRFGSERDAAVSGLSVRPAGAFEIVFEASQASGTIRLRLVRTPDLQIRVLGSPVQLESGPDRVTVSNASSRSSYEILVPESASSILVRVEGEDVFVTRRGEVQGAGHPDSAGFYVLDLAGSDP
jgi:anti-sigma factor RsiW